MKGAAAFWLGLALILVGLAYVEHLENSDCRDHGGTVVDDECRGAK